MQHSFGTPHATKTVMLKAKRPDFHDPPQIPPAWCRKPCGAASAGTPWLVLASARGGAWRFRLNGLTLHSLPERRTWKYKVDLQQTNAKRSEGRLCTSECKLMASFWSDGLKKVGVRWVSKMFSKSVQASLREAYCGKAETWPTPHDKGVAFITRLLGSVKVLPL